MSIKSQPCCEFWCQFRAKRGPRCPNHTIDHLTLQLEQLREERAALRREKPKYTSLAALTYQLQKRLRAKRLLYLRQGVHPNNL